MEAKFTTDNKILKIELSEEGNFIGISLNAGGVIHIKLSDTQLSELTEFLNKWKETR